jgi:glycosyltransferase involved in cell wall biosynthesis
MKTFATLALPGSYVGPAGQPLVGRLVANTELLKALFRHGSFERYCFFTGEAADRDALQRLFVEPGHLAAERLLTPNLLELPHALATGAVSVLHHGAHVDQFYDLVWLRDRHARGAVPVTGQIHSLSYPRLMQSYLRGLLSPPGAGDAIFCSSHAGRLVVEKSFAAAADALRAAGGAPAPLGCELPVVPLGVDVDRLRGGDGAAARARLGIPRDALVLLALGRFTEYDKMDLFPLIQVLARVSARRRAGQRPLHLLLAGARQGTKTPEMLALWAQALGVAGQVTLDVDFAEADKPGLLAAADLFVSPCDNVQETFGISVIEAMAAGLPAVVSDFDGYKDSVTPDVGVRVKTRGPADLTFLSDLAPLLYERPLHLLLGQGVEIDLDDLERAIASLADDDRRREEMSRRAAARARASYDWSVVIAAYEAVWRRLATRRSASAASAAGAEGARARHPLAMPYAEIFSHYPTEAVDPLRLVRRSDLGRAVAAAPGGYVVYPELRNVFSVDDVVVALLAAGDAPIAIAALARELEARFAWAPEWRAQALVTWLLKHGLLRGL